MQNANTFEQLKQTLLPEHNHDECLPAWTASVWGAFLHEGLMDSIKNPRDKEILGQWSRGCLELIEEACRYLPDVWEELYRQWGKNESYCGVFEYEVVSVLGHYLGDYLLLNNGELPHPNEVKSIIQALVYSFLESNTVSH